MSKIDKILVFSQTKSRRVIVGTLWREKGRYFFAYDKNYRKSKGAVALGPEFDLWKRSFSGRRLFPSLADRIPSPENPAYADYCRQWGIDVNEKDPFVLLTTIGRRGPSTFVFEPPFDIYDANDVKGFRERLGLTQREFASLFGLTQATVVKLEAAKTQNQFILLCIELCDKVPAALQWLVEKRGRLIHDEKRSRIVNLLLAKVSHYCPTV